MLIQSVFRIIQSFASGLERAFNFQFTFKDEAYWGSKLRLFIRAMSFDALFS